MAVSLLAILLHFFCLVPLYQLGLSQGYGSSSPGTTHCEEHAQSIPPLPALGWEKGVRCPPQRKIRQHSLVLAEQAEEGADKHWMHPLSSSQHTQGEARALQNHGAHKKCF